MHNYLQKLKKAKKTFPTHKKLLVRIKDSPTNPFYSFAFEKLIRDKELYSEFIIYIHEDYVKLISKQITNFEPVKLALDSKLWIELYEVFDFIKVINKEKNK